MEDSERSGTHLFSFGLNLQPTVWRSRKNDVRLDLVLGAGVGTVVFDSDEAEPILIGHINLGLGVHYFPSRPCARS